MLWLKKKENIKMTLSD